jgi:hypothetical protein
MEELQGSNGTNCQIVIGIERIIIFIYENKPQKINSSMYSHNLFVFIYAKKTMTFFLQKNNLGLMVNRPTNQQPHEQKKKNRYKIRVKKKRKTKDDKKPNKKKEKRQ